MVNCVVASDVHVNDWHSLEQEIWGAPSVLSIDLPLWIYIQIPSLCCSIFLCFSSSSWAGFLQNHWKKAASYKSIKKMLHYCCTTSKKTFQHSEISFVWLWAIKFFLNLSLHFYLHDCGENGSSYCEEPHLTLNYLIMQLAYC